MSSHMCADDLIAISIGDQKNDAGEPLVVVGGAGIVGTLGEVKAMIERFETREQSAPTSSHDTVAGFDEGWFVA